MNPIPYLPLEKQIDFLYEHRMINTTELGSEDLDWISSHNFHYLLGYARNLRSLRENHLFSAPNDLDTLRKLIAKESEFVGFLTPWLRKAECHLRSLTVKYFCSLQNHGEGYLNTEKWKSFKEGDLDKLQFNMLDSIRRHGEPYAVRYLENSAEELRVKLPDHCGPDNLELWKSLTEHLPLWAVVDSFSIGTLGKFIEQCGQLAADHNSGDEPVEMWKLISQELGIGKRNFGVTVNAFGVLRNTVLHHQRLWMRPMAISPGLPNEFERKYRHLELKRKNKEAQFIILVVLSKLLPKQDRNRYLMELEAFLAEAPLFAVGIETSPFA